MTSVGLFWFFFRERLRNAFLFAQFRAKNSERLSRGRGTSWKVLAHPSTYTRALGVAPDPRPGCSRGTGAMALEPPSHAGKRPGSLRASDGASSSGLQSAPSEVSAADSMRQVAARLEKHTAALRSAMDQTSRLDDGSASDASAKGALAAAAARALDADAADAASSSDDDDDDAEAAARETRLRSYQTADVYIKKAAAKIAGHKKWYADRAKREKASESCAGALEELRLASMVLQRRHDEDAADECLKKKSSVRRRRDVASGESLVPSVAGVVDAVSVQSAVDALVATARRLRADADAAASREADARAELAEARRREGEALAEARVERVKRETTPPKIVVKSVPHVSPGLPETADANAKRPRSVSAQKREGKRETAEKTEKTKTAALRDRARATPRNDRASLRTEPKPTTTALTETADDENAKKNDDASRRYVHKTDPNPALVDALRLAKMTNDDLERRLTKTNALNDTKTRAFEAAARDAAARLEDCESRARALLEEGARWKALYVAARDDRERGVGADEAEALRAAARASEDARRRELTLLGAEHGNQCASLRRALADSERERLTTSAAAEAARRAAKRNEEALVSAREARREAEVLKRRSDAECRRVSARCEALEADVASLNVRLEETERASRDLQAAETAARQRAQREAAQAKEEAAKDADWRVEALEARLAAASETARREKARADDAERALDDARRHAVEQQAQMAEAARRRKEPDAR